eukprot:1182405-Prorocentrum_minimum.AAC.2
MVLRLSAVCGASGAAIRDGGGQHRPSVVRGRPLRRGQAVRNRPGGFQVRHRGLFIHQLGVLPSKCVTRDALLEMEVAEKP